MHKIKKTDHFYLIDGSGYIFRAYYALPPLTRKSDGLPTGAVSGFCSMLFKLLEDSKSNENLQKPTHFAVIFDSPRKTSYQRSNSLNSFLSKLRSPNKDIPLTKTRMGRNRIENFAFKNSKELIYEWS